MKYERKLMKIMEAGKPVPMKKLNMGRSSGRSYYGVGSVVEFGSWLAVRGAGWG